MARSLSTQSFSVPSQPRNKIVRLSEARFLYETKLRELEHKFESQAAELREEYLAIILQIHKSPER